MLVNIYQLISVRSGVLSVIWGVLNALTSLTILSLISINIPGTARVINKTLLNLAQLDFFPTTIIFPKIFTFDDEQSKALNPYFDNFGESSMNSLVNM